MSAARQGRSSSWRRRAACRCDLRHPNERAFFVELILSALWPVVETCCVDYYLAGGIDLNVRAVHRSRRGTFEVYPFAGVPAPVARTFELVFAGFPVGRASEVCAASIDDEESRRISHDPNTVLLLELGVDPEAEV